MMHHLSRTLLLSSFLLCTGTTWSVTVTTINIDQPSCGFNNGRMHASIAGGIPPYSLLWSTGATTADITGLAPGTYSVTVTDGLGSTDTDNTTISMVSTGMNGLSLVGSVYDCNDWCAAYADLDVSGLQGVPPFTYDPPPSFVNGNELHFGNLCGGMLDLTITDANGCTGTWNYSVGAANGAVLSEIDRSDACGGLDNGMFIVLVSEGGAPGGFSHCVTVTDFISGMVVDEFPLVSDGALLTVDSLPPSVYQVSVITCDGMGGNYCPGAPIDVSIGNAGSPCGMVQGMIHHDADQDCVYNGGDIPLPYKVLTIQPGPAYAITDGNGHYEQTLNYGAFTIEQSLTQEEQLCPAPSPVPFTIDAVTSDVVIDMADSSTVPHDVDVYMHSTSARPGFPTSVHLHVRNNSAYPSGNATVGLVFDPLLLNPLPAPAQWNFANIAPYASHLLNFTADVPANINLLGTVMNYTATVTNSASELNTANNVASLDVTITGSYDPNDKQGRTSTGWAPATYFLDTDEWIDYTIRFQNTGTAAAETVTIRDTIDGDLFIPSLEILGASHAFTPSFGQGRKLVFTFTDINLPDSTSDWLGSQGFISYRIKPNDDLIVGTLLENTAGIHFDFNPPIITNTVTHVVDFSTAVPEATTKPLLVMPNPLSDLLNITGQLDPASTLLVLGSDGRVVLIERSKPVLDVSRLAPGAYVLRVMGPNGDVRSTTFIKH